MMLTLVEVCCLLSVFISILYKCVDIYNLHANLNPIVCVFFFFLSPLTLIVVIVKHTEDKCTRDKKRDEEGVRKGFIVCEDELMQNSRR